MCYKSCDNLILNSVFFVLEIFNLFVRSQRKKKKEISNELRDTVLDILSLDQQNVTKEKKKTAKFLATTLKKFDENKLINFED